MESSRFDYVDMGKALGMLCVMWGHLMLGGITNYTCYAFHIPFFFFLSGLLFRPGKYPVFRDFLVRRVKTLLVPYWIFSLVTWAYWVIRGIILGAVPARPLAALMQTFVAQGSAGYLRHNVALWFVTALFVTEMLCYFLSRLSPKLRIPALILCGVLGCALVQPNGFWDFRKLPWNLEAALTGAVFYGAGQLLSPLAEKLSRTAGRRPGAMGGLALVFLGLTALGAHFNGHVSVAQGNLGASVLLFYLDAACGIAGLLLLSMVLAEIHLPRRLRSRLLWFGRHSFWAMCIHVPVMVDLVWVAGHWTDRDALRYQYAWTVPIFLGMVLVTGLWMALLSRKKS